ncbi:MAG: hypothetical protein D3918_02415 [Candidatus Electrothrix sp. AX2]|nr:hypothetical protein [Candidatus Electrothrix gigas]
MKYLFKKNTNPFFFLLLIAFFLPEAYAARTVDRGYVLGEKDTVNVQVYVGGEQQIATDLTVDNDGRITVPILGSLQAKGLTPAQLEQSIRVPLARDYFVNPQVILKVTGFHSLSFFISGAINSSGKYDMEEEPTLMELIGKAGGLKEGYGHIAYITHKNSNKVTKINLVTLLNSGSGRKNIRLKNGDTVQIPFKTEVDQAKTNVFIEGEVKNPGMFPYRPGLTALNACVMAGGFTESAAPERATIIRKKGRKKQVIRINLEKVRGGRVSDSSLQPGDFLNIPEKTNIYIEGEVKNPGMFPYRPGLTALNACVMAGGFSEIAASEHTTIIRRNGQQKKVIKVDLKKVKAGKIRDFALRPGDFINVPEGEPGKTNIYIEGEVKNPGMFPYRPGLTALNACVMAGGFNEFAAPNRTKVIRKDGQRKKVIKINLERVKAGDILDLPLEPGDFINVPETWL